MGDDVIDVELLADNKDGLLHPGAFTRVHFRIPPDPNTFTIPASAMLYRDTEPRVATVGADNRIVLKDVRIVRDLGTAVEVAGGVTQDERIVANPPDSIGDGEEVRVMEAAGGKTQGRSAQQGAEGPADHPKSADEMAPPILPDVFMTDETAPAESAPISSVMAQETPTVDSIPNIATQESHTETSEFFVRHAGTIHKAETRKPPAPTMRRADLRLPDHLASKSENQPPKTSPTVPANNGMLA